ncbi:hypothetical protein XFF6994_5660005 [Xanthomonas citri pv. fuscans]|nr:hypothetical protein XFF6994_5660005 [Xanthomonas citri pv. fuscans]
MGRKSQRGLAQRHGWSVGAALNIDGRVQGLPPSALRAPSPAGGGRELVCSSRGKGLVCLSNEGRR